MIQASEIDLGIKLRMRQLGLLLRIIMSKSWYDVRAKVDDWRNWFLLWRRIDVADMGSSLAMYRWMFGTSQKIYKLNADRNVIKWVDQLVADTKASPSHTINPITSQLTIWNPPISPTANNVYNIIIKVTEYARKWKLIIKNKLNRLSCPIFITLKVCKYKREIAKNIL